MDNMVTSYSICARADENNKVIKIFSTCFETPVETDIILDTGSGDKYVHVQSLYNLFNEDGTHRYCIDNNAMRECTEEEIENERASFPEPSPTTEERVSVLEEENELLKADNALLTECVLEISAVIYGE